jgi:hypothetical protein
LQWLFAASRLRQAIRRRSIGAISWSLSEDGMERQLWGFTLTLGYSRRLMASAATDQKLGTLLRMHEAAFAEWGAVPEEILYDGMRTVWNGTDERGEIVWNAIFLDFARYWGFKTRLCRPYRAQTKGKVESGVKYLRRNFLCGLLGREPASLADLNGELRRWVAEVANQRVHGTTHQQVLLRWDEDQFAMQPVTVVHHTRSSTKSSAKSRAMPMSRGSGAATRCRGSMRVSKCGCRMTGVPSRSATGTSESRCILRLSGSIRWSRFTNTMPASRSAVITRAARR